MGLFITFEGGEGSGKSFQARKLTKRLQELALPVVLTYEPGGTPLGNKIRLWLKRVDKFEVSPLTELMLFDASRAQLVNQVIKPNLEMGKIVICDRYTDSTLAYQGYGRGLNLEMISTINNAATLGLIPDLTVLLDIAVEAGLARKKNRKQDRFEREALAFHQRVREGYLKLAAEEPQRWLVVDTSQSKEETAGAIWHRVTQVFSQRGAPIT
ncbi:MAG: dTMP kinase [Dehalococcoidales bacterium]|nr:dTMP kinase [Dehalococcoidales bacterium]